MEFVQFPHPDPLGQRFGLNHEEYAGAFQIVGVFADFILSDPRREAQPLFLRPLGQVYTGFKAADQQADEMSGLYLNQVLLQFNREQPGAEQLVRKVVDQVNANIPVIHVLPYPKVVADNFNQERLLARLTEAFGLLALILASVGLYGVMSYVAVRRTSEIGIRMALGASRSGIIFLRMRGACLQVLAGLAIGIPAGLAVGRMMDHLLYGVSGHAPLAFAGAAAVLAVCMSVAALIPAMRAASLDPMHALRTEGLSRRQPKAQFSQSILGMGMGMGKRRSVARSLSATNAGCPISARFWQMWDSTSVHRSLSTGNSS